MNAAARLTTRPSAILTSILFFVGFWFCPIAIPVCAGNGVAHQVLDKKGPCLVLACDGGGARGLLTAMVIEQLEKDVGFLGRVHVFAGTSTGGIIALGLADDQKISELVALYRMKGEKIFQPYEPEKSDSKLIGGIQDGMRFLALKYKTAEIIGESTRDFFYVKYDNKGLKKELESRFDPDNSGRTLAMLKKHVLVTTLQLQRTQGEAGWAPLTLHNLPIQPASPETGLVEAALCTSAAPLYFPPYKHAKLGYCADGGLFANSPGAITLANLIRAGYPLESMRMLSIGTGAPVNHFEVGVLPFKNPGQYGLGAWLSPLSRGGKKIPPFPLIAAIFDATSAADVIVCQQFLTPERYQRAQVPLREMLPLDARDEDDIRKIEDSVQQYFRSAAYGELKKWVETKFVR